MELKQYSLVLVNLDPTLGSEMKKTRPCVIISPNEINYNLQTITIAPITSTSRAYPTRIELKQENVEGWIVLDQIRTIDKIRVVKNLGSLSSKEILKVKAIIKETFVD